MIDAFIDAAILAETGIEQALENGTSSLYLTSNLKVGDLDVQALRCLRRLTEVNGHDFTVVHANLSNLMVWTPLVTAAPPLKKHESQMFGEYETNVGVVGFMNMASEIVGEDLSGYGLYQLLRCMSWWMETISRHLIAAHEEAQKNEEEE